MSDKGPRGKKPEQPKSDRPKSRPRHGKTHPGLRGGPLTPAVKGGSGPDSRSDRPPPLPSGFAPRDAAVHILEAVLVKHLPLDRALEQQEALLGRLEGRDRGFALTIVRTVLRRLKFLETVLASLIERPLPADAARVRLILLAGAAQIALLDTPPHAAVNLAVEQCRKDRVGRYYDKLANAVMRRIKEASLAVAKDWDAPRRDLPSWLFERWRATYGEATARDIATASLGKAALDITVKSEPEIWAQKLGAVLLPTGSLRLAEAGSVTELAGFADGAWWVQDAAAALPARLLGDVRNMTIADLCAAPGGKTAQLATAGAKVIAIEASANRINRLAENLDRLQLTSSVRVVEADLENFRSEESVDAVLLDAPCSATGTIRRHPDILHLKTAEDVTRLAAYQGRLLEQAALLVRPGGRLVYCTCSLEPEEGVEQISRFLAAHPEFTRAPIAAREIGGAVGWITPEGDLRTLPFHMPRPEPDASGLDGFFAARLIRKTR